MVRKTTRYKSVRTSGIGLPNRTKQRHNLLVVKHAVFFFSPGDCAYFIFSCACFTVYVTFIDAREQICIQLARGNCVGMLHLT